MPAVRSIKFICTQWKKFIQETADVCSIYDTYCSWVCDGRALHQGCG